MQKKDLKSLRLEVLVEELKGLGEKAFRAKQIYDWIHVKNVISLEEMRNISKDLKAKLQENYDMSQLEIEEVQESKQDGTRKYLFRLADGFFIESVFMKYKHGNSVCVSSQVGCRMGCKFCASTLDGLERNLLAGEILEQIYAIERHTKERVSNIVIMGMGEPLDNYENVVDFIRMISDESGKNISQRNITLSTCGLVDQIKRLADEKLQITLALSLHATNDTKRKELMPIANKYKLLEVLEACQYYYDQTKRRLTFEYALVSNVNDREEDAKEFIQLVKHMNCHINLIPVNPIKEREFSQSTLKAIQAFKDKLERNKINVTVRREMGRDIDGACGQLRRKHRTKEKESDKGAMT